MTDLETLKCKAKRTDNGEWVEGYYLCQRGQYHLIAYDICVKDLPPYSTIAYVYPQTVKRCIGRDAEGRLQYEE